MKGKEAVTPAVVHQWEIGKAQSGIQSCFPEENNSQIICSPCAALLPLITKLSGNKEHLEWRIIILLAVPTLLHLKTSQSTLLPAGNFLGSLVQQQAQVIRGKDKRSAEKSLGLFHPRLTGSKRELCLDLKVFPLYFWFKMIIIKI